MISAQKDPTKSKVIVIDFLPNVSDFEAETSEEYQTAKKLLSSGLEEYGKLLDKLEIPNELKIVEDCYDVREGLCRQVNDNNVDILVMGNTCKSGVSRFLSSPSVSEYCVRNADCVVVVVK
eukprot:TRINITY_DN1130_c0_g1_i2.p1 TRINITY_DN1130_c0_g1~~TRINITY_DN1130_c0_g1_i2.p1  ORF type:complete len:121 (-),score=23.88 TRINITY_DN1130_c0_g1_i2:21-383(-)